MSKISEIFDYMRTCPELTDLWSIGATEDVGVKVVLPQGASPKVRYDEFEDSTGMYNCDIIPYDSVYEDYQINCYQHLDANDRNAPRYNVNVLSFDEVQSICDWIEEQNDKENFPKISGKKVIAVECYPFVPQIRFVDELRNIIGYFITIRIRYVNTAKWKHIQV